MQKHKEAEHHVPVSMETIRWRLSLWFLHMPLTVTWLLRSCYDWRAGEGHSLTSPVLFSPASSARWPRPRWETLPPPPGNIIMTLLWHRSDVIMQHAAAEDHGTFFSRLRPVTCVPGPCYGDTFLPPHTTTCRPLSPYSSEAPRRGPPMRWKETV